MSDDSSASSNPSKSGPPSLQLFADDDTSKKHVKFILATPSVHTGRMLISGIDAADPVVVQYFGDTTFDEVDLAHWKSRGFDANKINCFYYNNKIYFIVLPKSEMHDSNLLPRQVGDNFHGGNALFRASSESMLVDTLCDLCRDVIGCVRGFAYAFTFNDKEYQTIKVLPNCVLSGDSIRTHAKVLQTSVKGLVRDFFKKVNVYVFGTAVGKHMPVIGFENPDPKSLDWVTACGLIYSRTTIRRPIVIACIGKYYVYC